LQRRFLILIQNLYNRNAASDGFRKKLLNIVSMIF